MIQCHQISLHYDQTPALNNLSLEIEKGERLAVLGPSGCGKSSLLQVMFGLLKPQEGQVYSDQHLIEDVSSEAAIVFQEKGLFPWLTVKENICLPLLNEGLSREEAMRFCEVILKRLGMANFGARYCHELSGGQQQRVAIARALVMKPKQLFLDEPSSGLDMMAREDFQNLLIDLWQTQPMTMVVVTHDLEEAAYLGQKIVIMDQGEIVRSLPTPFKAEAPRRDQMFYDFCLELRQVMAHDLL